MKYIKKHLTLILAGILLVLVVSKYIPYLRSSIPLGYDPGLFRSFFTEYFHHLPVINYSHLSPWITTMYEPFLGYLSSLAQLLGYTPDFLLSFGLVFFSILSSACVYLVLRTYNKQAALLGALLSLVSIIQYQAFRRCYYKQILGIIFMLTSIYFLKKEQTFLAIPAIIATFIVHRPAGLFLFLTLMVYGIGNTITRKKAPKQLIIALSISGIFSLIAYWPLLDSLVRPLISPLFHIASIPGINSMYNYGGGTFFGINEYLMYTIPYLLVCLYGIYLKIKEIKKENRFDYISAGLLVGFIRTFFQLFLYKRMLIFADIFIILLTAQTLSTLLSKRIGFWILSLFFLYQIPLYGYYVYTMHTALIPEEELTFITSLKDTLPAESIMMVADRNYTPRVVGYTEKATIAPGLLSWDPWTKEQWTNIRWGENGEGKCKLIHETPFFKNKKVFLRIGSNQGTENLSHGSCFYVAFMGNNYSLFAIDTK